MFTAAPPVSISWKERLQDAATAEQVLALTQDFLTTWSASDLASLPLAHRQIRVVEPDDIAFYAFELVREQCLNGDGNKELQQMAAFFGVASGRLAQLMANVTARDNKKWQHAHTR